MLVTASWSSSGRYGICSMISLKVRCTLRVSASSSGDSSTASGTSSIRATRYGSSATKSPIRTRSVPCTRIRTLPSGTLSIRATTPATPTS